MKRFLAAILLAHCAIMSSVEADIGIPDRPPLPEEWAKRVIPGFVPCIELTVDRTYVYYSEGETTDEMRKNMSKWGPDAVPALMQLYDDPEWQVFRGPIAGHLGAMPTSESQKWANAHAFRLLNKPKWTKEDCFIFRTLGTAFGKNYEASTFELALVQLPAFASQVSPEEHDPTPFDEICLLFERTCREGLADVLEILAFGDDEDTREVCLKRLVCHRCVPALLAAVCLGDETRDTRRRSRLVSFLKYDGGRVRAQESMDRVLDSEGR